MDENEVIDKLCKHLKSKGWHVDSYVAAGVRGIDVVAKNPLGQIFHIEAKGGTSSDPKSARYGSPFTKSQVFDVTSKGLMQCFHHIAKNDPKTRTAFVYPSGKYFAQYIDPILPLLQSAGLCLFRVNANNTIDEYFL